MFYSINWPNVIVWLPLFLEILSNICIAIVCYQACDVINIEINPTLLVKPFFYITKTTRQKFKYLENEKSFLEKHFSSFLKGFQVPKIVSDLRVHL